MGSRRRLLALLALPVGLLAGNASLWAASPMEELIKNIERLVEEGQPQPQQQQPQQQQPQQQPQQPPASQQPQAGTPNPPTAPLGGDFSIQVPAKRLLEGSWQPWDGILWASPSSPKTRPDLQICFESAGGEACTATCADSLSCSGSLPGATTVRATIYDRAAPLSNTVDRLDEVVWKGTLDLSGRCRARCELPIAGGAVVVFSRTGGAVREAVDSSCGFGSRFAQARRRCGDDPNAQLCKSERRLQAEAAQRVRSLLASRQIGALPLTERTKLLEDLVAAPETEQSLAAKKALYRNEPNGFIDRAFWSSERRKYTQIASRIPGISLSQWAGWAGNPARKRALMIEVSRAVLTSLDSPVRQIVFETNPLRSARYDPSSDKIYFYNSAFRLSAKKAYATIIEESIHAYQLDLAERQNQCKIDASHASFAQARAFNANFHGYYTSVTGEDPTYRYQPLEFWAKGAADAMVSQIFP